MFVAHSFPRFEGDAAGAFLLSLSRGLERRGHDILAVVPHDAGLAVIDRIGDTKVQRYAYGPDEEETLAYRGTMADQVMRSWSARLRLLRFLAASRASIVEARREWKPDLVHVHWWFPGGVALRMAGQRSTPSVLTSHGTDLFLLDRMPSMKHVAGPVFRAATRVTVISTPLVRRVAALGVSQRNVSVIPMPVDASLVRSPGAAQVRAGVAERSLSLLFAGRLVERKGAEYSIRALAQVVASGVDATLTIAGDGPLRVELVHLCDELSLSTRVRFLGMLTPAAVTEQMRAADIFLMPAVTDWKGEQEGFGMVIVEAMLSGLPVIASASGGIPDIIENGRSGILVPERDASAIAASVLRIAEDRNYARALSEGGRRRALDHFHPDRIAERFEGVYLEALNEKR